MVFNLLNIAIEIMKTPKEGKETKSIKKADKLTNKIDTRFICIPGIKPVKIPAMIPNKAAIKNSRNILPYNS
jgi:hypothetical protein